MQPCPPERQDQPQPPEHRHQSPPPRSLQKPLKLPHPLGADTKNNGNYEPAACEKETPNTVNKIKREDREICSR